MAKVKKSLLGTAFIESIPKKLDRVQGSTQSMLQPAVIKQRSVIEVKDANNKGDSQ